MLWTVRYKTRGPVREGLVETDDTPEGRQEQGPKGGRARAQKFLDSLETPAAVLISVEPTIKSSYRDDVKPEAAKAPDAKGVKKPAA